MMHGDRFRAILAGGGGYGDPFERDPELVRADVMEEKLSIAYARKTLWRGHQAWREIRAGRRGDTRSCAASAARRKVRAAAE